MAKRPEDMTEAELLENVQRCRRKQQEANADKQRFYAMAIERFGKEAVDKGLREQGIEPPTED